MADNDIAGAEGSDPHGAPHEEQAEYNAELERREVKQLLESYEQARKFDKAARKQYAVDRRYAAGTADLTWAVSTNLIGSYIEVLVSYLYARNPDVSVRPAEHVAADPRTRAQAIRARVENEVQQTASLTGLPAPPEFIAQEIERRTAEEIRKADEAEQVRKAEMAAFAKTLELVIARLWKAGKLKHAAKKIVRSALSVGPGWLKVIFVTDKRRDPQIEAALNDARDNLARLEAKQKEIAAGEAKDTELAQRELEHLIRGLEAKVEVIVRKGLAIDFCAAEDVQVSLDVRYLEDYLEAGWIGNAIYKPKSELAELFPRLTPEKIKKATCYYQRKPNDAQAGDRLDQMSERDAEQFATAASGGSADEQVEFAKIIEIWDRRDNLIKTMVDGIDCWAREPYPPPYASSRFYPYFYLAFYETDGSRHPQSLSWRLRKLQDEYASTRSNFRLSRERSIPGVMFNAEQIDPINARKLEHGVQQEFIGIKTTNPNVDFRTLFAEKPIARLDPLLFDVQPIMRDMEKISGVQESLQASVVQPKTATEAEIQQSGFAARSSAARDVLEDMLTDLAQYTAEIALQALTLEDVRRMVGPAAFWPEGMDIEDLLTLVEVDIEAGSTGKPNTAAEREAWAVALPLIRETMVQIQQAQAQGNMPLAQALIALLRETLNRMGDRIDVEKFIPQLPAQPAMPIVPDGLLAAGLPVPAVSGTPMPAAAPGSSSQPAPLASPASPIPDAAIPETVA